MLDAEIGMAEALFALASSDELEAIRRRVAGGELLSRAISALHPPVPAAHRSLMSLAERNGALAPVLSRLADADERATSVGSRLAQAAGYPLLIMVLLLLVSLGFSVWVLPQVAGLAAAFDAAAAIRLRETRAALRTMTIAAPLLAAAGAAAVGACLRSVSAGGATGEAIERGLLRVPAVGDALRAGRLSRLFFAIEVATGGGATLADAVAEAGRSAGGAAYPIRCGEMGRALRAGAAPEAVFADAALFPPVVRRWIAAAGVGVSFATVCTELRGHFDAEQQRRLEGLIRLGEPCFVTVAGAALLGFVAVAVLPVLRIYAEMIP
jgi:type II secretory pathway component PulF